MTSENFGLNKEARLRAERKATKENLSSLLIEPDFPYQQQSFDPGFFGLQNAVGPADDDLTEGKN